MMDVVSVLVTLASITESMKAVAWSVPEMKILTVPLKKKSLSGKTMNRMQTKKKKKQRWQTSLLKKMKSLVKPLELIDCNFNFHQESLCNFNILRFSFD